MIYDWCKNNVVDPGSASPGSHAESRLQPLPLVAFLPNRVPHSRQTPAQSLRHDDPTLPLRSDKPDWTIGHCH